MKPHSSWLFACFGVLLILLLSSSATTNLCSVVASSPNSFSSVDSAINSAYVATLNAQKNGGNVSIQIDELNQAISLYEMAQAENSSNPAKALIDLNNAARIAEQVSAQSMIISQAASPERQIRTGESIGSAIGIVVLAALIYAFSGRIYRWGWLRLYRNHLVKPTDE